jgi:transposase-like protein
MCRQIAEGRGDSIAHTALQSAGTGSGVVAGREIQSAIFRCSHCDAVWQRETETRTLRTVWYLQARQA